MAFSLTEAGIAQIKQEMPFLKNKTFSVVHHPHYRDNFNNTNYDPTAKIAYGINEAQCVYSFIGTLRTNKCPDLVIEAFLDLPPSENFLLVAGSASEEMALTVTKLVGDRANLRLDLHQIPEAEIARLYSFTDIIVFPGTEYLNSGTIYTSLSLNVPVVAAWSPTNEEIQTLVGKEWLYLYKGNLTVNTLKESAQKLIKRSSSSICNLSQFSPQICAHQHLTAYQSALKMRDFNSHGL